MTKVRNTHNLIMGLFLSAFMFSLQPSQTSEAMEILAKKDEEKRIENVHKITYKEVDRVEVLEKFLEKYNSPLKDDADTFVRVADEQGLDYRLLPAISCMESTCGKFVLPNTYNAWGWGMSEMALRNGTYIRFKSWEEAIETVGDGIAENYADKGLVTPEQMAPVYTPPNSVKWRNGVRYFMNQMDEIAMNS